MNKCLNIIIAVIVVFTGGCSLAPEHRRPASPVPSEWPRGAAYKDEKTVTGVPKAAELKWQEFFTDDKFRQVVELALNNNRDLRIAVFNVERARALYGVQRAELLPTVNAVGAGSKERVPADLSSNGSVTIKERYSVDLGISSWEIDFFGRIRNLKDRALEEYLATDQARNSARILLISTVANAYLKLATDGENLKLAQSTLETQETAYKLIRKRYDLGIISELDLNRAQSQVDTAKADVARYTQFVAQDENALNLLAGVPVPQMLLSRELVSVSFVKDFSPGLSSEVLLLRPDVLAAEHQLKAANANIGAARAAFFPRIALTTAVGTASAELSGLFKGGSATWSFAPQIAIPIFDARTWSAYDVTKADREISVAVYEKAIQNAFREVADSLAVQGTVDQQIAAQQSLVNVAADIYRLSNARYNKGIDSYLSVLDAQRSLYVAQQGLIGLQLVRLTNQVTLYKALGGGQ